MNRLLVFFGMAMAASAALRNVVVDTDAGSDDMMAIAFLLSRADVHIEAITVVNGIAHVHDGAVNVLRLLDAAGKTDIPVYEGRDTPLKGTNAFPDSWRMTTDAMVGVDLPATTRKPEPEGAVEFLTKRLQVTSRPFSILALGPLSNIAEALGRVPRAAYPVEDMVIMGGAVRVRGNKDSAEWNIYVDPSAAETVFRSPLRFRLVPLDACNQVPFDPPLVADFIKGAKSPLAKVVASLLESSRGLIAEHIYYAWDPLAAVALMNPAVLKISSIQMEVKQDDPDIGRTVEMASARASVRVALDAEPASFRKTFFDTLGISSAPGKAKAR